MKKHRLGRVLFVEVPAMVAGIQMRFVSEAGLGEHFIELFGTDFKSVVIFAAAVEIKLQSVELLRIFRESHRIIGFPIDEILVDAVNVIKDRLEHRQSSAGNFGRIQILEKHGAVRAG